MSIQHTRRMVVSAAIVTTLAVGSLTRASAEDKVYHFGVSNFGAAAEYMHKWTVEMQNFSWVKQGKVTLTVTDARYDPLTQSNQIDSMITQKVNALILAPFDYKAGGADVDRVAAAGIPVIGAIIYADSKNYTAYIGHDEVEAGRQITEILAKKLGGKGNVVLLEGVIGMSSQIARNKGVEGEIAKYPGMKLIEAKPGDWSRAGGQSLMENWLLSHKDQIDGVIGENDEMALGAIEAIKGSGTPKGRITVVAIDGIDDGVRAVSEGWMYTTLRRDILAEGDGAMDLALRAVVGPTYKPLSPVWGKTVEWAGGTAKTYTVPYGVVNAQTVASFK